MIRTVRLTVLALLLGTSACSSDPGAGMESGHEKGPTADGRLQMVASNHPEHLAWKHRLDSSSTSGQGVCAGRQIDEIVAQIHATFPPVSGITTFRSSGPTGPTMNAGAPIPLAQPSLMTAPDGTASFFTAYGDDGAFGIVFFAGKQCRGELCAESEYWYFETGAACTPKWVGHFHKVERPGGRYGTCVEVEGAPLWGWPQTPAARSRCDVDWSATNISGKRKAVSIDPIGTCAKGSVIPIELTITQGTDLSKAQLTMEGTGIPFIDGAPLWGTVERESFDAETNETPSVPCAARRHVKVRLDFEGPSINGIPGGIGLVEISAASCTADPKDTTGCEASLHLVRAE